jgi:Tol biopolymer transport system component
MRGLMTSILAVFSLLRCAPVSAIPDSVPAEPAFNYHFITNEPGAIDLWPCFSPDGKTVLFSRTMDKGHTWDLFVIPAAGGEPKRLSAAPLPVSATRANWSHSKGLIAFTGETSAGTSVWLINPDGTGARRVQASGLSDAVFYPSWYPAGKTLAVVDFGGGSGGVIKMIDLAAETATPLTTRQEVFAGKPSVSPDGQWIVMAAQKNRGEPYDQLKNSIWLRDNDGKLQPLDPKQGRAPVWSHDGRWVTFQSDRGSPGHLYAVFIARPNGDSVTRITPYALNANHPVWSSDGTRLVVSGQAGTNPDTTCGLECPRGLAIVEMPRL